MVAQDHIINFNGIVKNRLGPYKIVLKNQNGDYLSDLAKPTPKLNRAFNYAEYITMCIFYDQKHHNDSKFNYKPYLTTASKDIELERKDFGPSALGEWEGPGW
jgi:hypothetical protein